MLNKDNFKLHDMKKWTASILVAGILSVFTSCEPDKPLRFETADGIYFNAAADSIIYSFAKYPNRLVDTINIPVSVLGKPATQDREIGVMAVADTEGNAIENTHYKLLPPYKILANSTTALMPVVIYRSADLDNAPAVLKLQLKENDQFQLGISAKSSIKLKVGYLQKPPSWGDPTGFPWAGASTNFGTWTKTKYKLILEALYDPISGTTVTEFAGNRTVGQFPAINTQYLQAVINYIRTKYPGNYTGTGATLTDPDIPNNPVIKVGPANY
ncbi:hypothetical protein SY85_24720 [Flavisolibacter tropicus]|uniref:DUF4843 domain-containing protein n=2 Tax=Flavisolibacter tropicus TaxID=1492898 RepID=A0A172U1K6_9BACT|nr:hypothetical protein SY85_24720 [Flavisolibacter tropicus]